VRSLTDKWRSVTSSRRRRETEQVGRSPGDAQFDELEDWARRSEHRLFSPEPMARAERWLRRHPNRAGHLEIRLWAAGIAVVSAIEILHGLAWRPILGIGFCVAAVVLTKGKRHR
jgi:hypothetical protein